MSGHTHTHRSKDILDILRHSRLEGIDFNKGFEQAVQLVAYNGKRFDFAVLKKQSSESLSKASWKLERKETQEREAIQALDI